ncbi:hypothetical protein SRHO_G00039620, partial [Serrasalmus rhombeus]
KRAVDKSKAGKDGEKKDSDSEHTSQTPKKSSRPKEKPSGDCHAEQKDEQKKLEEKVSDTTNKHRPKTPTKTSSSKGDARKKRDLIKKEDSEEKKCKPRAADAEKDLQSDDFEMPSMSFEAYLSYDLEAPRRKRRSCDDKPQKRWKTDLKEDARVCVSSIKSSKAVKEESDTTASKGSVLDLLKVPLPAISTECEDLSQYQYFAKNKVEEKPADVCEEAPVFTGQRLNRKMQVYSGSKVVYLPTMMTLYQQCIRTLQNNIDSLYEIGGVPFEILEPVLERCTPEQLLRIEECNPVKNSGIK